MPMTRTFRSFPINDFNKTKQQMLHWVNQFSVCCFLDNNQYNFPQHSRECLVGAGLHLSTPHSAEHKLASLRDLLALQDDWVFGHLSYDLKNEIDNLQSSLQDRIGFSDLFFFIPQYVLQLDEKYLQVGSLGSDHEDIFSSIVHFSLPEPLMKNTEVMVKQKMDKELYLQSINAIKEHIRRGDCYELNFCQEFYADGIDIDPIQIFSKLGRISPNPFAAFYKTSNRYLLCASPERYIKKTDQHIISQPIKGTSIRNLNDKDQDKFQRDSLLLSQKERSENVMVVDLVRNDLARVCVEGTVEVDELFGIYSFPQVHQMISTISGKLKPGKDFVDIVQATFPMGSMTGAPKRKVMQLIEKYEKSRRGLFSGAVGYIAPGGDFDFNVVIRSILYNADDQYLSFSTGSAITHYSDPEAEYAECMLKGGAMRRVLEGEGE
jgi:para-aminobenzoate synthetase component I